LQPGVCGRLGNCGKEWKRNERTAEEPGKVREEEKAVSECWEDENNGVQYEKEEEWREWVELGKKGNRTSKRVQILGLHTQRKSGGDFKRKIMMFKSMVESILMYGAKIWRWMKQEEEERVQEKYLR
jgi:hypothetical protein